jgi:hypothetical protein
VLVIVFVIVLPVCAVVLSPLVFALSEATQENVDAMFAVNARFTAFPEHSVAVFALVIAGVGFTVTVTVCEVPGQLPAEVVGVTVYVTVCTLVVEFVIVLESVLVVCAVVLSPLVFALSEAIHEKVEATFEVSGILTVPPLQMVAEDALVTEGVGFTVTLTVCPAPVQLPPVDVGVTVYVTVCALVVELVIVFESVLVLCAVVLSPVVFALSDAIHENVEATFAVKGMLTAFPEQIVAEPALVIAGVGFTVTVTVCAVPAQLPPVEVGVTV